MTWCKVVDIVKTIKFEVIGVIGIPEIETGNKIGETIFSVLVRQGITVMDGDVFVIAQKIVSKSEGRLVQLNSVQPSEFAKHLADMSGRDPRLLELVLMESNAIIRMDVSRGLIITETRHGYICANAGIDTSNVCGDEVVSLLPEDPDGSARSILDQIQFTVPNRKIAVIISDTFGRSWREGHTNVAIGLAGMDPFLDYRGTKDTFGNILAVTRIAVADELASAAELVMGKANNIPVAIVRGFNFSEGTGKATNIVREKSKDLFR